MLNDLDDILESNKPITIEHYKKLIDMKVLDDPLLFLDAIVKGKDPRAISDLSAKVLEIDVTMLDQNSINIIEDLKDILKYKPVPVKESIAAAVQSSNPLSITYLGTCVPTRVI